MSNPRPQIARTDMTPVMATLLVLALSLAAFLSGRIPSAVVAIATAMALWGTGVITLPEALAGFSDPSVVFIAALLVVNAAVQSTGLAARVARVIAPGETPNARFALLRLMIVTALLTPFAIPSAAIGATMPAAVVVAGRLGIPPSRLLLPAVYAAHAGSMLVLTGTPVNAIVSQKAADSGGRHFGFLEFGLVGVPLLVGTLLLAQALSPRLPSDRVPMVSLLPEPPVEGPLGRRSWAAIVVLVAMVVALATGIVPPAIVVLTAAGAMVLLRVIALDDGLRRVPWSAVLIVAGMLPMSTAFISSGAADMVGDGILDLTGQTGPHLALLAICLVTVVLGQFITNMATTLIVAPIAISVAGTLEVSVMPFMMALTVAAAASFFTPIATPANTMVLEPGGYRFSDYARYAPPFGLLFVVVAVLLVPVLWPF
ncbi:MAG: SLC13 family permease [Protaetiibacter sp.]